MHGHYPSTLYWTPASEKSLQATLKKNVIGSIPVQTSVWLIRIVNTRWNWQQWEIWIWIIVLYLVCNVGWVCGRPLHHISGFQPRTLLFHYRNPWQMIIRSSVQITASQLWSELLSDCSKISHLSLAVNVSIVDLLVDSSSVFYVLSFDQFSGRSIMVQRLSACDTQMLILFIW